jgi:hypothetical protein
MKVLDKKQVAFITRKYKEEENKQQKTLSNA